MSDNFSLEPYFNDKLSVDADSYRALRSALYGYNGTNWRNLRIDLATRTLQVIDYAHHEIHSGNHYVCREVVDLPINNVYDIQITTPNTTKWGHMIFSFEVENETEFWVYENVTINIAGTALTCGNRDRNSANTAGISLAGIQNTSIANANADTAIAGATLLAHGILGSGVQEGGASSSREEVILKQNEDYTVRFSASAAVYVNFQLDWYEHTNKDA